MTDRPANKQLKAADDMTLEPHLYNFFYTHFALPSLTLSLEFNAAVDQTML